jgi:hypothetical protein
MAPPELAPSRIKPVTPFWDLHASRLLALGSICSSSVIAAAPVAASSLGDVVLVLGLYDEV